MSKQTATLPDISKIFDSLESPHIVFAPDAPDFTIIYQNQAHVRVSMTQARSIVGKPLLVAFPDTSEKFRRTGVSDLIESLQRVVKTKRLDTMPAIRYDLTDESGALKTRHWAVTHYPILENGQVVAIYQETRDITDEISIGKQLDRAEHQLQQVLASNLIGTWFWDIERQVVTTDSNLAKMFGISVRDAKTGLPLSEFINSIHVDDRQMVQKSINIAIESGGNYEEEYRTLDGNGNIRWVIARGHVEYQDKKPLSFSGVIFDITDRKQAEEMLSESERSLRFMADSMPQLLWITRPDGYHEHYNQRWYEYTGTKPGTTDGEGWNELFHPDDRARAKKVWDKSLKTGNPYEIEYRLYHAPSETYRWVIGRALPFCDGDGKIIKWYGTCTDIHERKRAADIQTFLAKASNELSSSLDYRKTLQTITKLCVPTLADWCSVDLLNAKTGEFDQVSIAHTDSKETALAKEYRRYNPINVDDPTGVPNVINTGKAEFYPVITNQMLEDHISEPEKLKFMKSLNLRSIIVTPIRINDVVSGGISFVSASSGRYFTDTDLEVAEELAARISLAITNSKLYDESVLELKNRQKLEKELLIEKQRLESRVKERTKQLQLTNEGLRDEILKRQVIERELQNNTDNLKRSNAELEDFAYVASHDLQEPLRKIQAFSDLLDSEYSEQLGQGADYVKRMNAAAMRMSTLIQDLLTFSRVTTKMKSPERVDLRTIVSDVVLDLETSIEESGGTVSVGNLPRLVADPTHMRQLFQNLIGNALKFHKPDELPVVEVGSRPAGKGFVDIWVKDNGIGFDTRYTDKIFAVFQRLHGRESYEGTGIGLAVCRKIVERYGGTIKAESQKNKGATFTVTLPTVKEE